MRAVRPFAASWLLVVACASGSENNGGTVDAPGAVDAPDQQVDASAIDAPETDAASIDATAIDATSIDATSIDAASIDAATTDAMTTDAATDAMATDAATDAGCTTMMLQLLVNPAFDGTPIGTGWVQTPHDAAQPIITAAGTFAAHTTPNKAWLGGWRVDAVDVMYQQVTVPAGTTQLTLTGQYAVGTEELGSTPYDTAALQLHNSSGGLLQNVMSLSNATTTTGWTPFNYTFPTPYAGQVVRLNFRSVCDSSWATNFFFDSVALTATVCQ